MITFKQFISEEELLTVKELIERDCKPFLDESKRTFFLTRGIGDGPAEENSIIGLSGKHMMYFHKQVRTDRKPTGSSQLLHQTADAYFEETFGVKSRSNSMFTFSENGGSSIYDNLCVVFPIGNFKFVWSPDVRDMFASAYGNTSDQIRQWLERSNYQDDDFVGALKSYCEIMVTCGSYYAFPIKYKNDLRKILNFK
jgi:hypothetical protein